MNIYSEARRSTGMSQGQVSRLMEIPVRTIQAWETGRTPVNYVGRWYLKELAEIKKNGLPDGLTPKKKCKRFELYEDGDDILILFTFKRHVPDYVHVFRPDEEGIDKLIHHLTDLKQPDCNPDDWADNEDGKIMNVKNAYTDLTKQISLGADTRLIMNNNVTLGENAKSHHTLELILAVSD